MSKGICAMILAASLLYTNSGACCMPANSNTYVNRDTVIVTFRLNMGRAITTHGFFPGDTLLVYSGYFGTALDSATIGKPVTQIIGFLYKANDTIVTTRGSFLDYQYVHIVNGKPINDHYYNFEHTGVRDSESLMRQITVPDTGALVVMDTATCDDCPRRGPAFESTRVLSRSVRVRWMLDIRPAYFQIHAGDSLTAVQGARTVKNPDSISAWGVYINGPSTGGWGQGNTGQWGMNIAADTSRRMWDDGTHGDFVAGDSIYTWMTLLSPDSLGHYPKGQLGQVYKYSIGGSDNECGRGGLGNTHLCNIIDTDSSYGVADYWGSINKAFYTTWDYRPEYPVGAVISPPVFALNANLQQNYPNPFNPSTTIRYGLPTRSHVTLTVYNILGQIVSTLVNGDEEAGYHEVKFDGSSLASGVYFYRITAGDYVAVKKLLILR